MARSLNSAFADRVCSLLSEHYTDEPVERVSRYCLATVVSYLPSGREVGSERPKIIYMLVDVPLHLAASLFQRKRRNHSGN